MSNDKGLSDAAAYAIAQARQRLSEQRATHCRCGVPRDQCGQHKHQEPAQSTKGTERVAAVREAMATNHEESADV